MTTLVIKSACCCNIGKIRTNNEDNFYFNNFYLESVNNGLKDIIECSQSTQEPVCMAVFDGMGGECYGEVAANSSASVLHKCFEGVAEHKDRLGGFINNVYVNMNTEVCEQTKLHKCKIMGSTAAMVVFYNETIYISNVGDSRIYRLRDNMLKQISEDHVRYEEGDNAKKGPLTQHLGIFSSEMEIEPYIAKGTIQEGDRYLICSDGLTDMLKDIEIGCYLAKKEATEGEILRLLLKKALKNGGKDNITMILATVVKNS